jgi:hypothetical protein
MDALDLDVRRHVYARAWWGSRLDAGWRPRALDESQALLENTGLAGDFWALEA